MAVKKDRKSRRNSKTAKKNETLKMEKLTLEEESGRVCAGVLTSHRDSRDIKIEQFSLSFHSDILIHDSTLELNFGRRYGLIGENGCGKSTLLKAIASGEVCLPTHIDTYLLDKEYPPTDMTALDAVINDAKVELKRLENEMEKIMVEDPESPLLDDIYDRMEELDESTFESKAATILHGLGFTKESMFKKTKDLSGGWRMRVSLAKALFVRPTLLLLDQPTNHLDLGACVWLEEYLKSYNRILLLISHSQDFLNNVCTNIIDFTRKKQLVYYTGNYDTYVKTREELETNQMKAFEKQQNEIEHLNKFIRSAGTYSNLVRQAKSKQKIIDKMEANGLVEKVEKKRQWRFKFQDVEKLPPPVLSFTDVSFSYTGKVEDCLYRHLDLGADMDSRIALVGPNGAGKSTLLKLMAGELVPISGQISRHTHLKIGRYNQHSAEQLDMEKNPVAYMRDKFPELSQEVQFWRSQVGRFGITSNLQATPIKYLSDGQKSRVVFCELALQHPFMLLLDEPTNALDIETIDSLADAINNFNGGVVLVSHDFRLISQVAEEIWVCENGTVTKWDGTIESYKEKLRQDVMKDFKL